MVWSVVLFLIGALFGVAVLQAILKNRPTPKTSVYLHGTFQVIAFIILLATAAGRVNPPTVAIVLLAIAALGGLVLFGLDMSKKPLPRALAIVHPILGVAGLVALIIYLAGGPDVGAAVGAGADDTTRTTAPGNTGAGGMGGTTATGTMGGAAGGAATDTMGGRRAGTTGTGATGMGTMDRDTLDRDTVRRDTMRDTTAADTTMRGDTVRPRTP